MTLPTQSGVDLVPMESPAICPGCGWGYATRDGFCLDCSPSVMGGDDEYEDDE